MTRKLLGKFDLPDYIKDNQLKSEFEYYYKKALEDYKSIDDENVEFANNFAVRLLSNKTNCLFDDENYLIYKKYPFYFSYVTLGSCINAKKFGDFNFNYYFAKNCSLFADDIVDFYSKLVKAYVIDNPDYDFLSDCLIEEIKDNENYIYVIDMIYDGNSRRFFKVIDYILESPHTKFIEKAYLLDRLKNLSKHTESVYDSHRVNLIYYSDLTSSSGARKTYIDNQLIRDIVYYDDSKFLDYVETKFLDTINDRKLKRYCRSYIFLLHYLYQFSDATLNVTDFIDAVITSLKHDLNVKFPGKEVFLRRKSDIINKFSNVCAHFKRDESIKERGN